MHVYACGEPHMLVHNRPRSGMRVHRCPRPVMLTHVRTCSYKNVLSRFKLPGDSESDWDAEISQYYRAGMAIRECEDSDARDCSLRGEIQR